MRFRITLKLTNNSKLPYNYNYKLSSGIYNLLRFGDVEFSNFLHDVGFTVNNKTYKLFTFSLRFKEYRNDNEGIILKDPTVYLLLSSPKIDDFLKNILLASFKEQKLILNFTTTGSHVFTIEQIEEIPTPKFRNEEYFTLISPLVLSTMTEHKGKLSQYYLRYTDNIDLINKILNSNLRNKYKLINNKNYSGKGVTLNWDKNFIEKRKHKSIIKKSTFNIKGNTIDIIGNLLPFTMKGDTELMRVGYEAGFGEKNSMGFGMAKVLRN